jgi:putative FmdB family regulatory protein
MPSYDYICQSCGHKLEHFQSVTSRHLRKCPKCLKPNLIRQIGGGSGVIFKGDGFYETDYKKRR